VEENAAKFWKSVIYDKMYGLTAHSVDGTKYPSSQNILVAKLSREKE
jgi:hypothetical protein